MSTGGTVDTVESLREKLKYTRARAKFHRILGYKEELQCDRAKQIGAFDMYVAALLPALVSTYPNVYELTHKICEIVDHVMGAREEWLSAEDVELPDDPDYPEEDEDEF
jgi:hypothetical protein